MSSVDTRPVPVSLLRWPRTRDLITQHKCILLYLWCHPEQTAAGCYLLPIDATAADLSMTSASLMDALAEFERRGLILFSHDTGELAIPDWFRWYFPKTAAARGAVAAAIARISSSSLREKVEKSYKSIAKGRKEKEKEKENLFACTPPAPPGGGRALRAVPACKERQSAKKTRTTVAGVTCWGDDDEQTVASIVAKHGESEVQRAARELARQGLHPLPSRVVDFLKQKRGNENARYDVITHDHDVAAAAARLILGR